MKKRIFAGVTALVIGAAFAGEMVWAKNFHTAQDETQLQSFLLQKDTDDLSEKDYDLNGDGVWDGRDLCLLRKQMQEQDKSQITFGTQTNDDFLVDNVLHSDTQGEIHFSSYIPESYDGSGTLCTVCHTARLGRAVFSGRRGKYGGGLSP
ncbi:hypothetical protein [Ruminococcus sp.]|uniref:hypothetical protein n=1 Tax=Ruminococcus sp. TaxID=41978 RepID=UPI0039939076